MLGTAVEYRAGGLLHLVIRRGTSIYRDQRRIEVEIPCVEIADLRIDAAFLESTGVENPEYLAGNVVRHVGNEFEGVIKRADDEAVVTMEGLIVWTMILNSPRMGSLQCERTFNEIEADVACVDDDESGYVSSRFIDHGGG